MQSWFPRAEIYLLFNLKLHRTSDLLQRANSSCNHVPPRAAQKNGALVLGIMFENRYHENKALERCEFKNRGNLCRLRFQRFATTVEARRTVFLHCPRVNDSHGVL